MKKKKQQDTERTSFEYTVPDVVVADEQEGKRSRHILAKIFCLIAAIVVWLYVMNLESTDYERTFADVPVVVDGVAVLNASGDMSVISGYSNTVDVTVSGKKSEVQAMTVDDIRASVDVSTLTEAGRFSLPITVQVPGNMLAIDAELLTAEVYIDVNTTREVPVRIDNLDYITSSANILGEPILSMETVPVTGPAQVLELIDHAALSVDLGNVTTSTTVVATPTLVDADGVRISNPYVRYDVSEITVKIPVETEKAVKLTVSYALPELASVWMAEITPETVTVKGDPMLLSALESVPIYEIKTSAAEGEYTIGISAVELPDGVTLEETFDSIRIRIRKIVG